MGLGVRDSGVPRVQGFWGSGVWEAGGRASRGLGPGVQEVWGPGGSARPRSPRVLAGAGASRYALIDVAATEAAHRAGAQHAQAREERLPAPEQRPKAAPR